MTGEKSVSRTHRTVVERIPAGGKRVSVRIRDRVVELTNLSKPFCSST